MLDVSIAKGWVIVPMNARMRKTQVGMKNMSPFAMMCYENSEEEKYEKGEEENKQESTTPDDEERKVDPGTVRNTEEPQGIPLTQLYVREVFTTGIMSDWAMSMIEDNMATLRAQDRFSHGENPQSMGKKRKVIM